MLAVTGMPKLKVIGDWDMWHARREMKQPRKALERYADRWHRKRSDLVVVGAKYLQDEFRKLGTESVYIPYATYLQNHPQMPSPFTAPTAVYMGILYPNYDYAVIFDAAMVLKRRGVEPRITFIGKGPELERWRQFVRDNDLKDVKLIGYQPEDVMWQHLRHARVNLFPIRPTLSNLCRCPAKTYAYAQARRPIITNRVGEVPPVLGEKAIYVDDSPEALANELEKLLDPNRDVPDVDYDLGKQSWSVRADELLGAMKAHGLM
jgi:glycosyltransferase involved in cell wall biosynthesis